MRQPLVIVVLTKDEACNLGKALRSVGSRAPVVVLDSGSTDRTCEIAKAHGAELHVHPFENYAAQRQHAASLVRDRYEWLFFLDADEEIPADLFAELERTVARPDLDGAYVGLVLRLLGYEMSRGSTRHYSVLRLIRTDKVNFVRTVNERIDDRELRTVRLSGRIIHEDLKPIREWFAKHIRYAELEAKSYLERRGDHALAGAGFATKQQRMVFVRWAYNRMPLFARPFASLTRAVVWQGAWKDGLPGLMFAGMQMFWYPMLIDLLILEERRRRAGLLREP